MFFSKRRNRPRNRSFLIGGAHRPNGFGGWPAYRLKNYNFQVRRRREIDSTLNKFNVKTTITILLIIIRF
jgi:hypothetical protein